MKDKRYDAVIHMVTAADGAEEFYDYANEARYENVEEARAKDKRLQEAYLGHHRFYMVDNRSNFQSKLNRVIELVSGVLGLPVRSTNFKKYLVDRSSLDEELLMKATEHSKITEYFMPIHRTFDDA